MWNKFLFSPIDCKRAPIVLIRHEGKYFFHHFGGITLLKITLAQIIQI